MREHWLAERRDLLKVIQSYPTPITACDVQFNTLLVRRNRLGRALRTLDALETENLEASAQQAAVQTLLTELDAEVAVGHASEFVA